MPDKDGRGKRKTAERELFKRWFVLTNKERVAQGFPIQQQDFKNVLGVSAETLVVWARQLKAEGIYPPKKMTVRELRKKYKEPVSLPKEMQDDLDYTPIERTGFWNDERTAIVNEAILESARLGNANAQKLAKQLAGELVEKKEVKFVLSAEDYFRIRREAQGRIQRLIGERDRDRGVQPESALLFPDDGISSEQEHDEGREVAVVGLST